MLACVCMYVCMRACVCVCVCPRAFVCLLSRPCLFVSVPVCIQGTLIIAKLVHHGAASRDVKSCFTRV